MNQIVNEIVRFVQNLTSGSGDVAQAISFGQLIAAICVIFVIYAAWNILRFALFGSQRNYK
jgi:hypothetical protein